jgi:hypothetical protein
LVGSTDEMAQAWIGLTRDHARRTDMAAAARLRARSFSRERSVEEFLVAARATVAARR